MRRMSSQDAAFLYAETPTWHMHVGALSVVDPSAGDGKFSFELLRELTIERLPSIPQFRWKLVDVPLGIDRPGWIEAGDIDPEYHIRRATVPPPGDEAAFDQLVADILSTKLDRNRPLWEIHVIDGLANGMAGVVTKMHHSLIDGVSGSGLTEVLLDMDAVPRPAPEVELDLISAEVPNQTALFAEGLVRTTLATPVRIARFSAQTIRQMVGAVERLRQGARPALPYSAPATPLNGEFTARRQLGRVTVSMQTMQQVKRALGERLDGVKMNDVVLGIVAGSLREYLAAADALPDVPLVVQVPVSLRVKGDLDVGSKVGSMFAHLPTHLDDPVERVEAIVESTRAGKEMQKMFAEHRQMGVTETMSPGMLGFVAHLFTSLHMERTPASVNLVVSNVPGPPIPLYMAGAALVGMFPLGPLLLGMGLNISVFSHGDQVDIGCLTCPDLVQDPDRIARGMTTALDELALALGIEPG